MRGVWRLLLARPDAVPEARHAVGELGLREEQAPTVELLTSELVSNAVLHGARDPHESILVHATREDGRICVRVCDEGPSAEPEVADAEPLDTNGRGLQLVDALATRWGTEHDGIKCVWFELAAAA